jgi:tellurite resistance protein
MEIKEILNSQNSKLNFMKGLIYLSKADGAIEESEFDFFNSAAVGIGLQHEFISQVNDLIVAEENSISIEFENTQQSLFFIREAMQLCYVDGNYDENEKKALNEISSQLSIKQETLDIIESWVIEGINWSKRGNDLLILEV